MATTVRLTDSNGNLGHRSLAKGEHQFCSVVDDTCILLTRTAQEARNIHKGQNLDVERVAETHEACSLTARIAVQHTGNPVRLVGDNTRRATVEASETADDILRIVFLHLHEVAVVHDGVDNFLHVVGLVGVCGYYLVQALLHAHGVVRALHQRRFLHVVLRDERDETAHFCQRLFLGSGYEMGNTRLGSMYLCTTQLLYGNILTGNGFHYLRTRDEHVRVLLGHHDKVRQRGAIYGTTGTGTEDNADLRHYAACEDVALENLGITCQGAGAFLNTSTSGVVQADDGGAEFNGLVHHIANLLRHGLAQRAADNSGILCEDEDETTIDSS